MNVQPPPAPQVSWVDELYALVLSGEIEDGADLIFERVDNMLYAGQLSEVDELLETIDLGRIDIDLMVCLLSITAGAKQELTKRADLLERIKATIARQVPERAPRLLPYLH